MTDMQTAVTTKKPETPQEFHEAMIGRSLYSFGDVTRMQNKLSAAKNGEEITVAFIGGSITEGLNAGSEGCYARLAYNYISVNFGTGDNVSYVNAGMSGTPSTLGALRAQRDILAYSPDIVFIEFAVNDGTDFEHCIGFESLIRNILNEENEPAVVIIINRLENGYTAQDNMLEIADYYSLPVISVANAITPELDEGRMVWDDYSDDESHPHAEGHRLVCEMIVNYLDRVTEQEKPAQLAEIPAMSCYGRTFENADIYENSELKPVSVGSFKEGTTLGKWKNGWSHDTSAATGEPIEFEITAKNLYLIFKTNNSGNLGSVDITVTENGNTVNEMTVDGITSNGWGNPIYKTIVSGSEEKTYHVSIKMSEGSESKAFEILGIGYTIDS